MRARSKRTIQDERTAFLFLSMFLLFFAAFKLYPFVYGFVVSFFDRNAIQRLYNMKFVWFENYRKALSSRTVLQSFGLTLEFTTLYTVLTMVISIILAALFNRRFSGRTVVRTMFYMPYVTNLIAIGVVWNYVLNPYNGPVNSLLAALGLPKNHLPLWLSGAASALPTSAVINTWVGLAFPLIALLAALQDIPASLYEAADLEGASFWQRLIYMIIPMLRPAIFFVLTITIIISFKNYTIFMALTGGGPGTATNVVSLQIYADAFIYYKFSIAAAEGVLLTLLVLIVNALVRGIEKIGEK